MAFLKYHNSSQQGPLTNINKQIQTMLQLERIQVYHVQVAIPREVSPYVCFMIP